MAEGLVDGSAKEIGSRDLIKKIKKSKGKKNEQEGKEVVSKNESKILLKNTKEVNTRTVVEYKK